MREIKLRAWVGDKKKMVYLNDELVKISDGVLYKLHPKIILMQFTGLLDKSGKEIYEGDILVAFHPEPVSVFWSDTFAGFYPFCEYDIQRDDFFPTKDCEVIGNIYENPELLAMGIN